MTFEINDDKQQTGSSGASGRASKSALAATAALNFRSRFVLSNTRNLKSAARLFNSRALRFLHFIK